ncbi:uncharacterized protein PFL1_05293 [Pseudozyma flocculosa PF-1]|uniref:Uncharacterized protein n=2 Tax=Pseudozyma flocculosa TaxID=84751 RepID=A0A5C3FE81_9BASI|nr:uncharacterized protein PFL1_05293 [Pseudozyma flocculosa PF-1]EPQ27009.1 hypothetical protein PFL1_05293 [Pseudozyma flocculosa PF-1]SPO42005.1 uncharacterized protein PSFLO_07488 [Pseudozyma flocculosa]
MNSATPFASTFVGLTSASSSYHRAPAAHRLHSRTTFVSDALRVSGSVLPRIFPSVLFVTLYATLIAAADLWYDRQWRTSNSVIGPLSVVVGLLIVFRNSSSFERWNEGRRVWQDASATVKNLAILVWCNVDVDGGLPGTTASSTQTANANADATATATATAAATAAGADADEATRQKRFERKKRAVKLLMAWMIAVKHHIRGEYGWQYADLANVLPDDLKVYVARGGSARIRPPSTADGDGGFLSTYAILRRGQAVAANAFGGGKGSPPLDGEGDEADGPDRDPGSLRKAADIESRGEREPLLSGAGAAGSTTRIRTDSAAAAAATAAATTLLSSSTTTDTTDLPTRILTALHVYVAGVHRADLLPSGPFHGVLVTNLLTLSQHFSSLLRISRTTIPQIYSIHLKQSCLLYLLALPLTLVGELGWRMVPFVTLVAITLMGLEGISSEVEFCFGLDASDHPLDEWCAELRTDLERLIDEVEDEVQDE